MIILYSGGMFIRISRTLEQKYMPMIWASIRTMMLDDLDDEIL